MSEQATSDVSVAKRQVELWVEDTKVRIQKDPEAGAQEILRLSREIDALKASQRQTCLRLAMPEDLPGETPVVWSTSPNVMGLRLILEGAIENGSKDIVQARVLRSKKGTFRVQTLSDEYRRGRLEGAHAVKNTTPTLDEYKALNRDYCVTGDLAQAVIRFCQQKNLVPALQAAGLNEWAKFYDKAEAPAPTEGSAPPAPAFSG